MLDQPRFAREAWVPLAAGLFWVLTASTLSGVGWLLTLLPGSILLAAGVAELLWAGDPRIPQFAALGALVACLFTLPLLVWVGPLQGAALFFLAAGAYLAAGFSALRQEPPTEEVPPAHPSVSLAAQLALDDALLATIHLSAPILSHRGHARIARETLEARALFEERGWLEKPADYHRTPPPLRDPRLEPAASLGRSFEHLSFESEYEPRPEEPGRARWLSYAQNRTAHGWVLRQGVATRPWLVCIHGYQMGWPLLDFLAFPPRWLHEELGLNLIMPILPLHGPRKLGWRSGDGFFAGDTLDSIHAEAQAMWDLRRILSWIRAQGATQIGVYGISLGGYNTALLASLDAALACAVAGIPATDFARLLWRHGAPLQVRHLEREGVSQAMLSTVLRVISPLALTPRVPHERRYIFGAPADRLVPADQVRDLWRHWERPRLAWYDGAHVTFPFTGAVRSFLADVLQESGLVRRDISSV